MVPVRIGPVPSASVLAWSTSARQTIETIRRRPELEVPPDVVEGFAHLVSTWTAVAEAADPFDWQAEMDRDEIQRLSTQWMRLATIAREPGSEIHPAPPEGQAFYDALAESMLAALTPVEDREQIGAKLDELMPDFAERRPAPSGAAAADAVRTVLLVDDTADIRMLFRLALDLDPRFEVFGEAVNGQEAVDACAAQCPDLVLLDLMMPVMTGFEALPLLRERCPDITVVVLSADDREETKATALRLGAKAFVAKTTSIEEVRRVLAAA